MPFPRPGSGGSGITSLTGDVTGTGPGATATTLASTANVISTIAANAPVTSVFTNTGAVTVAQAVTAGLAPLANPTFTGTPAAPTATVGTNTTQLATTAFVLANAGGGPLATAREVAVGTSPTTVLTYTPGAARNVVIGIYFRVITATTNVSITVTWTDVTGAQSLAILTTVPEVVGSYALNTFMIDSTAAAITVSVTAGTVSQVLASATMTAA